MDSLSLKNFVPLDDFYFGYVNDIDTAFQVLREFETITITRFTSYYTKDFGKSEQGKRNNNKLIY